MLNLNVSYDQIRDLINIYTDKKDQIQQEKQGTIEYLDIIESRLEETASVLDQLNTELNMRSEQLRRMASVIPTVSVEPETGFGAGVFNYNLDFKWKDKIFYIINNTSVPIRSENIVEIISKREPKIKLRKIKSNVPAPLVHLRSSGKIIALNLKGEKGFRYIPQTWVDQEGEVLEEYKHLTAGYEIRK